MQMPRSDARTERVGKEGTFPKFDDKRVGFPEKHPGCNTNEKGWFLPANMQMLRTLLTRETKVVIELGSYIGKSTRFICKHAPNALVYAVDLWSNEFLEKDLGHNYNRSSTHKIPYDLYDTFLANLWSERRRLMPLKMTTLEGLQILADAGVKPDIIYVDANHDFEGVNADIELSMKLFPDAKLVGDDWDYADVREAVVRCVRWQARLGTGAKEEKTERKEEGAGKAKGGEEETVKAEAGKKETVKAEGGKEETGKSAAKSSHLMHHAKVKAAAGGTNTKTGEEAGKAVEGSSSTNLVTEPIHVQDFKCWTIGGYPKASGDEVTGGPDNCFYHKKAAVVKKPKKKASNFSALLSSYSKAKKQKLR